MIKVGIIGATGYTGSELIRLLSGHPQVELTAIGARTDSGLISNLHKSLLGLEHPFVDLSIENFEKCDVVFLALPHGTSSKYAQELVERNVKVIDLGADFRLNDPVSYRKWYGTEHACEGWMEKTIYGAPELHKDIIKESRLVANPGCFSTSIILGLSPLCKEKIIDPDFIVADSDSGLTGAGKKLTDSSHFVNVNENLVAYNIGKHRHLPEIVQELNQQFEGEVNLVFNPHLAPINRGILSTITVRLTKESILEDVHELYESFYKNAPFVRVRPLGEYAAVKQVVGSNYCDISIHEVNSKTYVITSAIDNLIKGASGQAIQNMNIMFGFPETAGLQLFPMCP